MTVLATTSRRTQENRVGKESTFLLIKPDGYQFAAQILDHLRGQKLVVQAHGDIHGGYPTILKHYSKDDAWCCTQGLRALGFQSDEADTDVRRKAIRYGREVILQTHITYYMSFGYMHYAVLYGEDAVARVSAMLGDTEPGRAEVGTIRNMWPTVPQLSRTNLSSPQDPQLEFVHDSYALAHAQKRALWNVAHVPASYGEAKREAHLWLSGALANGFFPLV